MQFKSASYNNVEKIYVLSYLSFLTVAVEVLGSGIIHRIRKKGVRSAKIMGPGCHVIYRFLSFHSVSLSLHARAFPQRVNDILQMFYSPVLF